MKLKQIENKLGDIYLDVTPRFVIRFFEYLKYLPRKTKWFFQRAYRGWSDDDVWCMDYRMAKVLMGMLTRLRDHRIGWPGEPDFPKYEDWTKWLDERVKGFEEYLNLLDNDIEIIKEIGTERYSVRYKKAVKEMQKVFDYWGDLWD